MISSPFSENPFQDALQTYSVNLLNFAKSRDTEEKFHLLNENSDAVKLISCIVAEKIEEVLKASLQCSRLNSHPTERKKRSGTWDTVLGAATLVNTPARLV